MKPKYAEVELAESAFEILNDLMGDIHGARIPGLFAIKTPQTFNTRYAKYIVRNSIGGIVLALRKFDDLWTKQIEITLLKDEPPSEGVELHAEIEKKKIRQFCNVVIAHYSNYKESPRTNIKTINKLLLQQGFKDEEGFFLWTKGVIEKLEAVRNSIVSKYNLNKNTRFRI